MNNLKSILKGKTKDEIELEFLKKYSIPFSEWITYKRFINRVIVKPFLMGIFWGIIFILGFTFLITLITTIVNSGFHLIFPEAKTFLQYFTNTFTGIILFLIPIGSMVFCWVKICDVFKIDK